MSGLIISQLPKIPDGAGTVLSDLIEVERTGISYQAKLSDVVSTVSEALEIEAMKVELDNKVNRDELEAITQGVIPQDAVDTYNDTSGGKTSLLNKYPNPQKGWDVLVLSENTRYNWNGTKWVNMHTGVYNEDVEDKTDKAEFLNVSRLTQNYTITSRNVARSLVPAKYRSVGQIIVYRLASGAVICERFSGSKIADWATSTLWSDMTDKTDRAEFLNVSKFMNKFDYFDKQDARIAVPESLRAVGQVVSYKLSTGDWIAEQFVGESLADWSNPSKWNDFGSSARVFDGGRADTKYGGARMVDCGNAQG